jgi:hypothetical protein
MDDSARVLVAVAKFLMEVNPRLPAFWYSLEGNGPGGLSFGMCKEDFHHLLNGCWSSKDSRQSRVLPLR